MTKIAQTRIMENFRVKRPHKWRTQKCLMHYYKVLGSTYLCLQQFLPEGNCGAVLDTPAMLVLTVYFSQIRKSS
jgi:hypothetical protein